MGQLQYRRLRWAAGVEQLKDTCSRTENDGNVITMDYKTLPSSTTPSPAFFWEARPSQLRPEDVLQCAGIPDSGDRQSRRMPSTTLPSSEQQLSEPIVKMRSITNLEHGLGEEDTY